MFIDGAFEFDVCFGVDIDVKVAEGGLTDIEGFSREFKVEPQVTVRCLGRVLDYFERGGGDGVRVAVYCHSEGGYGVGTGGIGLHGECVAALECCVIEVKVHMRRLLLGAYLKSRELRHCAFELSFSESVEGDDVVGVFACYDFRRVECGFYASLLR